MTGDNEIERFRREVDANIEAIAHDKDAQASSAEWMARTHRLNYDYNFSWLGRPIIQMPQDIVAVQEIIWQTRPDLIIETGIAHGGSLIFHASMLHLLGGDARVLGIDVDIRAHNRREIESHVMFDRIDMLEGSSVDAAVVDEVGRRAADKNVLVVLDSTHTHAHVLRELELYSPFVKKGGYVVVFDTIIEHLGENAFPDRPWGVGDNPMTAVHEFLGTTDRFAIDERLCAKLLLTNAPGGYLRCVR